MRKTKLLNLVSILCTLVFALTALAGCSSSSTTEQVASASNAAPGAMASGSNAAPPEMASGSNAAMLAIDENAIYVQVQSIDGGSITALVGTMNIPSGQSDGNGGQPGGNGDQAQGTTGTAPEGTPAQPADNENAQGAPSGDKGGQGGSGGQGGMMGFTVGTETITFTVADTATITKLTGAESAEALLSDIVVGDILAVTLTTSNVAETIVIVQSANEQPAQQ